MAQIEEILGRNISSVRELKAAINELQNSLIGVDTESEQFKTTSEQLAAAQAELTKVTKAGKDENNAAADSLVGLRQQYKELYDQYKMLTDEQRNSDFGKSMADSLETLSNKINDTQKGIGDFRGNVGRYAQNITEAFNGMGVSLGGLQTPLKMATGGAKTFGTALKSLAANPIVLVITALVAILVKAAEAIKKNEELSNRLNQAMAALKPVTDALANVLDFLAGMIVKVIEGFSKAVEWISKINPKWNAAVKSHKELAKATNELTKAQRENSVVASQKGAEIEKLREEASATEDVTEKKRLLEEAKRIQQEVDQKEIELAQEELRILEEYSKKTANAAEDNEKLAAAQKKVNDAIAKGEQNMRMYNKQLDAAEKGTSRATSAGKNYREEARKLYEQLIEDGKTEVQKLTEKYEKEKKLLEKYHFDTTLLTKKYNKEINTVTVENDRKQLEASKESYRQAKETMDLNSKMWTDEARLRKRIGEVMSLKPNNTIFDLEFNKKYGKLLEQNANLAEALSLATEKDLTQITDYKRIIGQINVEINKYKETMPNVSKEWEKTLAIVQEFGEGRWFNLTKSLEQAASKLKTNFPELDLGSMLKLSLSIEDFKKNELPKLYDELYTVINETFSKNKKFNLFDEMLSLDTSFQGMKEYILEGEYTILEEQKSLYAKEILNFKGTQDKKLEIYEQYYAVLEELESRQRALAELNQERTWQMVDSLSEMTDKMAGAMSTYRSSQEALIDSQVKNGKIDEQEARKKKKRLLDLQAAETAFSIATIIADAASASFSIWKGYSTEVGVINAETAAAAGPAAAGVKAALDAKSLISAIAKQAGVLATAAAQVAAARGGYLAAKNNFEAEGGGGGSVGVAATPALIDSTPYSYARTVQTVEEEDKLNAPIYVTVTDIEEGLGQRVKVTNESSF